MSSVRPSSMQVAMFASAVKGKQKDEEGSEEQENEGGEVEPVASPHDPGALARLKSQPTESELYVSVRAEVLSLSVAEQRYGCGVTISFWWKNHFVLSDANLAKTQKNEPPYMVLLRHLRNVFDDINTKGNDAWDRDQHIKPFQKLYDPKQGETWWKYCYVMRDGMSYIDLFLYLRTTAPALLLNELGVSREEVPDILVNFLLAFIRSSESMHKFYQFSTNFSSVLYQLASLSSNFTDLEGLNTRIMTGEGKFAPDLFENCVDQQPVAWPQLCYYPNEELMQFVWEAGWTGERIEATMQEQMELQDYPLDRQLLTLQPKDCWADFTHVPLEGVPEHERDFFKFTIAPDLLSFSQWRYLPAVVLEREVDGERKASFAIRIERLLMPFVASVFLPQFLIVLLASIALLVDVEEMIDRANTVLTLLLTAVAMYFVVKQGLPEVPYITLLEKYVSVSIVLLALMAAESALVYYTTPETAFACDVASFVVLVLFWVVPHLLLVFLEPLGMFRRTWHKVFLSQAVATSPEYVSSHKRKDLCHKLLE